VAERGRVVAGVGAAEVYAYTWCLVLTLYVAFVASTFYGKN